MLSIGLINLFDRINAATKQVTGPWIEQYICVPCALDPAGRVGAASARNSVKLQSILAEPDSMNPPGDQATQTVDPGPNPARHEQRTLLNQIIGYSDLLIQEVKEWGRDGLASDLYKIRAASQRLLTLDAMRGSSPAVRTWTADHVTRSGTAAPKVPPGRILIVDDDEDNRLLLARRLEGEGHTVHTAESGQEALTLLGKRPVDLILLDMLMPGMNGQDVLKRLKDDPKQRHIPVLMFSGMDDLELVASCIELGAEDYLPKPCPRLLMQARIGACLTKKRSYEQAEHDRAARLRAEAEGEAEEEEEESAEESPKSSPPLPVPVGAGIRFDLDYRALIKVFGTLAAIWLLSKAFSVVVLLAISMMMVATLSPLVRRVESRYHRNWGIALVAVSVMIAAAGLLSILIPSLVRQGQSFVLQFPHYAQALESVLRRWRIPFSTTSLSQTFSSATPHVIGLAGVVVGGVTEVIMVAVLTIYLLIDGPKAQMSLIRLFPRSDRLLVRNLLSTLSERVGSYMRGQLLTSLLVGLFSFGLLVVCRVPEPVALALWMAVADALPLVGLPIGMAPAVLMALTQGPTTAIIVAVAYVLYHQFEITVLIPRLYSKTMQLSGSVILIAILIGGKLLGVVGALLALPVAAAIPVLFRYVGQWRDRQVDRQSGVLNLP